MHIYKNIYWALFIYITLSLTLMGNFDCLAQVSRVQKQAERDTIDHYQSDVYPFKSFRVEMSFEGALVDNKENLAKLAAKDIVAIDLVYSLYPKDKNFETLNAQRLENLKTLFPSLLYKPNIRWRYVGQMAAINRDIAKELFHGFVVYYQDFKPLYPLNKPLTTPISPETVDYQNPQQWRSIVYESLPNQVPGIHQLMMRKMPEWLRDSCVFIIDWTASMYPYGLEILQWLDQAPDSVKSKLKGFVLFNDGDQRQLGEKVIGQTGGIYGTYKTQIDGLLRLMQKVQANGQGGGDEENDLEALLVASERFTEAKHLLLVVDSRSFVRDLPLLPQLKAKLAERQQNLHILLCGAEERIVPDYFVIAHNTKSSLHSNKNDLENTETLRQEGGFEIEKKYYFLDKKGLHILPRSKEK